MQSTLYLKIDKTFRCRRNYRQLKVDDVTILACMLLRIEWRYPSEKHFHEQLLSWGITLPERTRYNRRCRQLTPVMKLIRTWLLKEWLIAPAYEVIDSAPITLASARRSHYAKVLREVADKGYNATKRTYYYGFELHAVMVDEGYFVNWKITPASVDERAVAPGLLLDSPCRQVLADGGYLSSALKSRLYDEYAINLWTPVRKNMKKPAGENTAELKDKRRQIETGFNNLNTVGHFEHPAIRTLSGLESRLEAMFLWHTINVHANLVAGISGLKIC